MAEFRSVHHYGRFGHQSCYELQKNQSDVTNSRWYNFFVNNLYIDQFPQKNVILFATVKFHISFEKRLKVGEQRKIPGVNITFIY